LLFACCRSGTDQRGRRKQKTNKKRRERDAREENSCNIDKQQKKPNNEAYVLSLNGRCGGSAFTSPGFWCLEKEGEASSTLGLCDAQMLPVEKYRLEFERSDKGTRDVEKKMLVLEA
jgi:hypothetical protein